MGWEKRKGRRFYYHTTCLNGRRGRVYLGRQGDPVAELAATHAGLDRVTRELDRRARERADAAVRDMLPLAGLDAATAWLEEALDRRPPAPPSPDAPSFAPKPG